jgi:two-component system sensor histidine kinase DesK
MRTVWLVFLIYPLLSVVSSPRPAPARVGAVLVLVAFAVVYVRGMAWMDDREREALPFGRTPAFMLGGLVLLAAGTAPVIGLNALGFVPFILSFAMFALPVPWAFALGGLGIACSFGLPALLGELAGWWSFGLIVVSVVVAAGVIRLVSEQSAAYEQMRERLAVVAERERVARDVHDVLGHSLTVVSVKAELAERLLDLDPERAKAELADIRSLSRQALAEIRATVGGLRVARLEDELASAAIALAGAGIAAELPDDPSVVDRRNRTLFAWVLREAVTNIVRHSGAGTCRVELGADRLVVRDDGRGLPAGPPDVAAPGGPGSAEAGSAETRPFEVGLDGTGSDVRPGVQADGHGLRGLRERVEAAGGHVAVHTGPDGRGTVVEVTM